MAEPQSQPDQNPPEQNQHTHARGSLLDGAPDEQAATLPLRQRCGAAVGGWCARVRAHTPSQAMLAASAVLLAASGAIAAHAAFAPRQDPDAWLASVDAEFEAVLLDDAFNRLPVDERVAMIGALVRRVQGMGSGDSVLLAALAARVEGSARDQLIENASRVMVDLLDRAGESYDASAPKEERVAQIESSVVGLMRSLRTMSGEDGDKTDEELLEEAREQAARDEARVRSGEFSADQAGRVFTLANSTVGKHSSAAQKARMATFTRDMGRVLRGEDPETGRKPTP